MKKLNKEFFKGNEVIFIGYSSKNQPFSKMIYDAFTKSGIKVYPVNCKEGASYDVKVYKTLDELPKMPETAYLLLKKENVQKIINELKDKGIKRILFQSKSIADASILEDCSKMGIETMVACPMMGFGTGFHRIHAFFAGVGR